MGDNNNIRILDDVFIIHDGGVASGGSGGGGTDTMPPTLNISWPLQDQTVYRSGIIIRGTAFDSGSGVREVLVHGFPANH